MQEVFGMSIPVDLAILSACESSVGAELAGSGLQVPSLSATLQASQALPQLLLQQ